jgi:hypothetical protein
MPFPVAGDCPPLPAKGASGGPTPAWLGADTAPEVALKVVGACSGVCLYTVKAPPSAMPAAHTLGMRELPTTSTTSCCFLRKSIPKMGKLTSANRNVHK